MPESSRWLMYHDRADEAFKILKDTNDNGEESPLLLAEFKEIQDTFQLEKEYCGPWKGLIAPSESSRPATTDKTGAYEFRDRESNARRFVLVLLINIFAQIVDRNIVSPYLSQVLDIAGVGDTRTQLIINVSIIF